RGGGTVRRPPPRSFLTPVLRLFCANALYSGHPWRAIAVASVTRPAARERCDRPKVAQSASTSCGAGPPMTDPQAMAANAARASDFLKALANPHRLLILCYLAEGEMSVGQLEQLLKLRQPTLSQQLARLREDALVDTRRAGKMIYYRLASNEAREVIGLLYQLFCSMDGQALPAAVRAGERLD